VKGKTLIILSLLLTLVACSPSQNQVESSMKESGSSPQVRPPNVEQNTFDSEKVENKVEPVNEEGKTSFRNVKWGMSKEQIMSLEKAELVTEENDSLVYKDNINGIDSAVFYNFIDNELTYGGYFITETHSNEMEYINDFNVLKAELKNKYGEPISDEQIWKKDRYKNTPEKWGMAILLGELELMAKWDTPDTEIIIRLAGDNYQPAFGIAYKSKELFQKAQEREKEQTKSKF